MPLTIQSEPSAVEIITNVPSTPSIPSVPATVSPDIFAAYGLSQSMMENIVIVGVIAIILGAILIMLWKQIVIGIMVVACVAVMANHKVPEQPVKKQIEIIEVDPAPMPEVKKEVEIEERSIYSNERP